MDTALRSYYLQAMGITAWRLRGAKDPLLYEHVLLVDENGALQASLLAEIRAGSDSLDEKQRHLLRAIVFAMGLSIDEKGEGDLDFETIMARSPSTIIMGVELSSQLLPDLDVQDNPLGQATRIGSTQIIVTHSLAQLLQQPLLKAQTWQHLKHGGASQG